MISCDELVERIATGDQRAFEEVFDRLGARALALVHLCGVNDSRCDEIVRDSFLEVWQRSTRFDRARGDSVDWILATVCRRMANALDLSGPSDR